MRYALDCRLDLERVFWIRKYRTRIPCLSAREIRRRHPEGDYAIVGEIAGWLDQAHASDVLVLEEKLEIPVLPQGSHCRPYEWIAGYVPVGKGNYIALVRSLSPGLMWRRFSRKGRNKADDREEGTW